MESTYSIGCFQWFSMSSMADQETQQYVDNQYPFKSVWHSGCPLPNRSGSGASKSPPWPDKRLDRKATKTMSGLDPNVPLAVPLVLLSLSQSKKKKKTQAGTGRGAPVSSSASPAVLAVKYISDWEVSQFRFDAQPQ